MTNKAAELERYRVAREVKDVERELIARKIAVIAADPDIHIPTVRRILIKVFGKIPGAS